jgi:hypothetical protein
MSLEYVREQFIGKDKHRLTVQDDLWKTIKEDYQKKLGYIPQKPMALITTHNPETPSVMEGIGFSEPNDIINNKFGALFAGCIASATQTVNLEDYLGAVRPFRTLGVSSFQRREDSPFTASTGSLMRVGRNGSALPVTRADVDLFDPFLVVPESNFFNTGSGGWVSANQQVVIDGVLVGVTSSGVIAECGLYLMMTSFPNSTANSNKIVMMSHDVAGASFSAGQNINVTYTWSIS